VEVAVLFVTNAKGNKYFRWKNLINAFTDAVASLDIAALHQPFPYLNSETHVRKEPFPSYLQLQKPTVSLVTFLHILGQRILTDFWFDRHSLIGTTSLKSY